MRKFILPVFLLILLLLLFVPRFFIKIKIDCRTQYGGCPKEVADRIEPLNGKSLFYADGHLAKELKSNIQISAFSIQFKLPNILRVDALIKKPIYAIRNENPGTFALIDKDGLVLAAANQTELPVVAIKGNLPKVGDTIDAKYLLALRLIDGVYKMYQVKVGAIEGDALLVDIAGPIRVIFPLVESDRDYLLGSLRLIYTNIQKGGLYSQIDLRYKNPVLR